MGRVVSTILLQTERQWSLESNQAKEIFERLGVLNSSLASTELTESMTKFVPKDSQSGAIKVS